MRKLAAGARVLGAVALVLSIIALAVAARVTADAGRARDEAAKRLAQQVTSLEAQVKTLAARADELDRRPATAPAAEALDADEVRRIVDERAREAVARATGRARLTPDELPAPVAAAARKVLEGAEIASVEQRSRDGRTEFRMRARLGGHEYDLRIQPDGGILQAEMPPDRAPQVVRDAVAKAAPGITLHQVQLEMDAEEGRMVYDVEGRSDAGKFDILVTPDGHLIEVEGPEGKVRFDVPPPAADAAPAPAPAPADRPTF